jgi:hypothetical protein
VVRNGRPAGADGQQSLGDLVASAAKDISTLLRYEITLAKRELKVDVRRIGIAVGLAVLALSGLCLIFILLFFALAYGLVAAFSLPVYVGFLGAAGACFVVILLIGATAFLVVRRVTGMKMTRKTVSDNIGALRRSDPSPNGLGPGITNPEVVADDIPGITPGRR